tara:strand:+ start:259 stop:768 length:510 start_codon:yes stop_codon:yes gene_type:complete
VKHVTIFLGVLGLLASSRFIPHPPNFTSLLALAFYIPIFFGVRYLPVLILCFAITDLFIGYHALTHWTWGSIFIIGLYSTYFKKLRLNIFSRVGAALSGSLLFFIITNFGVWTSGLYGLNFNGLITCYIMAIPFFTNTLMSTLVFSLLIEGIFKIASAKFKDLSYSFDK